jgi:hypothetical protein
MVSKFASQTYSDWYPLLLKIGSNPFLRTFHLQKIYEQLQDSIGWESW